MRKPNRTLKISLAAVIGAGMLTLGSVAVSQPVRPDTGMVFAPENQYRALPKRPRTRGVVMFNRIDLSQFFPTPGDQKNQGSCAAWSAGYGARSFYLASATGAPLKPQQAVSPSFVFNQTTPAARDPGAGCSGVNFPDTLDFMKANGALPMSRWPYNPNSCRPSLASARDRADAASLTSPGYAIFRPEELGDTRRFREVLAQGHPIIVAMRIVFDEYADYAGGVYKSDAAGDYLTDGHGMVVAGFDDEKNAFLLYNSWGEAWGEKGRMWIDYATFHRQVREAYVMEGLTPPEGVFATTVKGIPTPAKPVVTPAERMAALTTIAASARCGQVKALQAGEARQLQGFAGPIEADRIRADAYKADPDVEVRLTELPWPACEAQLAVIDRLDTGAISVSASPVGAPAATGEGVTRLSSGDRFRIDVTAPATWSHLQIFYLQADRSAKEIFRGEAPAGAGGEWRVSVGEMIAALRASEPYGPEAIIVLASDRPVIEGRKGMNVPEHDFLKLLKDGVASARAENRGLAAAIEPVQVLERDELAIAERWLVTPGELRSLNEVAGADAPQLKSTDSFGANRGGPRLSIGREEGAITIRAETGDITKARFEYRSATGLLDITPRLTALATMASDSVTLKSVRLPEGAHRLRLTVTDAAGRESFAEFTLQGGA